MRAMAEVEQKVIEDGWLADARRRFAPHHGPMQRPESITWDSRDWSDTREFIELVIREGGDAVDAATLAQISKEILEGAGEMDGPMPPDIAAFVERHRRGDI
jgi:hypothetical protein